jgi:ABC-type glutathione transport system ATPase component
MSETPLLELAGLAKTFRRPGAPPVQAVRDVDLSVGAGETVALVGESGSGKSTLGRLALCLLRLDAGTVRLAGQTLSDLSTARLRAARVAMQPVFQDPAASLNPRRTVLALLGQALRQRGDANIAGRAISLLEDVGLAPAVDLLDRLPHQLSGGQRQRLAIARALAMEPRLIIADEPLSGADVSIRGQILNLLADLQAQRGVAYLMITHDISLARAFAHRVAVMRAGELVETGPTATVLTSPAHAYTRALIDAVPTLDRVLAAGRRP